MIKKICAITTALTMGIMMCSFNFPAQKATVTFPINSSPPNELGIAKMLMNQGVIAKGASQDTIDKAVNEYIQKKLASDAKAVDKSTLLKELNASNIDPSNYGEILHGKKLGNVTTNIDGVDEVKNQPLLGTGKLLVLLVEFSGESDAQAPVHNQIVKPAPNNNADFWVNDFSTDHYQKMLFTHGGYDAINQNNKILHLDSMSDYYLEQSGGKYTVAGKVYGWYKVSHPESYYGDDNPAGGHDNLYPGTPQTLVEDVLKLAKADGVPFSDYDSNNDGIIDHLVIVHAGVDQSGGGGAQGNNAIWAHSSSAKVESPISGKTQYQPYIMQGENGTIGVFCHEYGHNLGLPDEYDTIYSGNGEPVGFYSIMASGSWTGEPLGTKPAPFSPWAKMSLGWSKPTIISSDKVTKDGQVYKLDQATSVGTNNQMLKVNLPKKKMVLNTPYSGSNEWYGGKGDEIDTTMSTTLDLTGVPSATLSFQTMYDIEKNWDFGFVQVSEDNGVTWKSLPINGTTFNIDPNGYPAINKNLPGFTGNSGGWVNKTFDLKDYVGKKIMLQFRYMTDWGTTMSGFFIDNIKVTAGNSVILDDGAENGNGSWNLNGWSIYQGFALMNHYYLMEWRNHNNTDKALTYGYNFVGDAVQFYNMDPGMLIWYRDTSYSDNWVGVHPGHGFLGIVDSHPTAMISNGTAIRTRIQLHDAAFNVDRGSDNVFTFSDKTKTYQSEQAVPEFNDAQSFISNKSPSSGIFVPQYGLKFRVVGHSMDNTVGEVVLYK